MLNKEQNPYLKKHSLADMDCYYIGNLGKVSALHVLCFGEQMGFQEYFVGSASFLCLGGCLKYKWWWLVTKKIKGEQLVTKVSPCSLICPKYFFLKCIVFQKWLFIPRSRLMIFLSFPRHRTKQTEESYSSSKFPCETETKRKGNILFLYYILSKLQEFQTYFLPSNTSVQS